MSPIICVKLDGGLGNQLFQYANARKLTENGGNILLDIRSYKNDYLGRKLGLKYFGINATFIESTLILKFFERGTRLNRLISFLGFFAEIKETTFHVHKNLNSKIKIFTSIQGYWQTASYFDSIRPMLLNELKLNKTPTLPDFINSNTIAVHVRRTDFLNDNRYGFLGVEYYLKAIQLFKEKIPNPKFVFFSDDLFWCKNIFKSNSFYFLDSPEWKDDHVQLYLITKCSHQIISNSTFSWWGAWLNQNPDKIVVRPLKPFNDSSILYENHYPETWIAL